MGATSGAVMPARGKSDEACAPVSPQVPTPARGVRITGALAVVIAAYLITGVMQPTLVDWIKYMGAAGMSSPPAMLTLLSNTLGMALVARVGRALLPCSPPALRRQLVVALDGQGAGSGACAAEGAWHRQGRAVQGLAGVVTEGVALGSQSASGDRHRVRMRGSGGARLGSPEPGELQLGEQRVHVDLFDKRVVLPTAVDLCSGVLVMMGLLVVGSGVYVVIYSSCTAWTAVLSHLFLRRRLTRMQWLGVVLCTLGLAANGLASAFHTPAPVPAAIPEPGTGLGSSSGTDGASGAEAGDGGRATFHQQDASTLVLGGLLVLAGSMLHSAMFVIVEASADAAAPAVERPVPDTKSPARSSDDPTIHSGSGSSHSLPHETVPPLLMCSHMGTLEACIAAAWIAAVMVWYSPQQVVLSQLAAHGTSIGSALALYVLLTVTNCLHALSFFLLIGRLGAVGSSVLKGLHAVLVFAFSATMYCGYQPSQCATWLKTCAMLLVLAGTLVYVRGEALTRRAAANKF